mgnify:CR=1 FL=1
MLFLVLECSLENRWVIYFCSFAMASTPVSLAFFGCFENQKYHSARNDHRFYGVAMDGGNSTMSAYSCEPDSDPLINLLIIIGGP